jgi:preprotein translocase subunit YajC
MFGWLFDLATNYSVLLAQLEVDPPAQNGAENANDGGGGFFSSWTILIMVAVMGLWFFLLIMRPQQRDSTKTKEMLDKLKKNDRVVTAGGIIGTVVSVRAESDSMKIRIDDSNNTTLTVLRQSVVRVLSDESEESKTTKK